MNIDPREQARAYEEVRVEDAPKPDMPENRREVRQVPEAVKNTADGGLTEAEMASQPGGGGRL